MIKINPNYFTVYEYDLPTKEYCLNLLRGLHSNYNREGHKTTFLNEKLDICKYGSDEDGYDIWDLCVSVKAELGKFYTSETLRDLLDCQYVALTDWLTNQIWYSILNEIMPSNTVVEEPDLLYL